MSNHEWTGQATCASSDPDLWFSPDPSDVAKAKEICTGCPVRRQCAERAAEFEGNLSHSYRHGIWAAQDTRERAAQQKGQHERSRRAAKIRDAILAQPGVAADIAAKRANCSVDHVYRVRRLHAAELATATDMAVAA
ncbi:WhiB family transcriptional regulator [Streptomyces yangpuensis]|uniref:WhiB family transcriptional regulator n=1 Tax=Streptomyces yangpuensis TaxID=1648182 RepID=UPI00364B5F63